jgi:hypothetical protein
VQYQEKPTPFWVRLVVTVVAWIPGAYMLTVLSLQMGWWSLLVWVPALWATWDYLRRGDMFGAVDSGSRAGYYLPGLWRRTERSRSESRP